MNCRAKLLFGVSVHNILWPVYNSPTRLAYFNAVSAAALLTGRYGVSRTLSWICIR